MSYDFWVVPYTVTTFPQDNPVRYRVFQCKHWPRCPGACRHHIESATLRQAKREAWTMHRRGVNCEVSDE